MPDAPPSPSLRRDLISAYAASAAKVFSWTVVLAVAYRLLKPGEVAMLALARSSLSILSYSSLGLVPAMIRRLAEVNVAPKQVLPIVEDSGVLAYATPPHAVEEPVEHQVIGTGLVIAGCSCLIAIVLTVASLWLFDDLAWIQFDYRRQAVPIFIVCMGLGMALRLWSDAGSAVLIGKGRLARDNTLQVVAELIWVVGILLAAAFHRRPDFPFRLSPIGIWFLIAAFVLLFGRMRAAADLLKNDRFPPFRTFRWSIARDLLTSGVLLTVAQLADYLYAPMDMILIAKLLGAEDLAAYTPAVQIDAGLLLLVTGLAATLLPRAAVAHAGGDVVAVRRYYVRGTLASLAMLAGGGVIIWALSPWLFRLWLGNDLPATQAILPLVLIHTIVGGSSAVGRSILLGMGKVKPYAIAALAAGVLNVLLSYCFVKFLGLGLNGIVYGTIVAVVLRCAVWQPWYVMRSLREAR